MERPPPPDGYRWSGRQTEIVLIDPDTCPQGHPFRFGVRAFAHCADHAHHGHTYWTCACGQDIYRAPGLFVGEPLECIAAKRR